MYVGGITTLTDMKIKIGEDVDTGKPVILDLDYAIEERMQVLGNSGSGKSHLVRCIAEQANGKVQQIIISPKKEFVTLREKFNYVHVGTKTERSKPDIELNTRHAGQLALKILETGMDAIIEFSEAPKDRVKYVRNFIEGLMEAQEHLWHPVMIVIDEIDIWAPEKGHGEAESLGSIVDLAARGRDKGFFLVAATQKLPKFNKDVASELNIKFIGKVSLDNDQTRAAQELGIPSKEKTKLKFLGRPLFHFYAFGPGLSDDVIKMRSLPVQTTHVSGYKRNKMQKPIPTPDAIKKMISQFSDLPQEAEKELKTKQDLQNKITEQNKEISILKRQQPKQDPQSIQRAKQQGLDEGFIKAQKQYLPRIKELEDYCNKFQSSFKGISITAATHAEMNFQSEPIVKPKPIEIQQEIPKIETKPVTQTISSEPVNIDGIELSGSENKILTAIVQRPDHSGSRKQISLMSGYSIKSSGFKNSLGHLRTMGLIIYATDTVQATEKGVEILGDYQSLPTDSKTLCNYWLNKVSGPESKILKPIIDAYPLEISREDIAEKSGYSVTSSGFKNSLGHLRTSGLVDYLPEGIKASKELFPDD